MTWYNPQHQPAYYYDPQPRQQGTDIYDDPRSLQQSTNIYDEPRSLQHLTNIYDVPRSLQHLTNIYDAPRSLQHRTKMLNGHSPEVERIASNLSHGPRIKMANLSHGPRLKMPNLTLEQPWYTTKNPSLTLSIRELTPPEVTSLLVRELKLLEAEKLRTEEALLQMRQKRWASPALSKKVHFCETVEERGFLKTEPASKISKKSLFSKIVDGHDGMIYREKHSKK